MDGLPLLGGPARNARIFKPVQNKSNRETSRDYSEGKKDDLHVQQRDGTR